MKRFVKLSISLLVRAWDVVVDPVLKLVGRRSRRICVVLYYHAVNADQRQRFARQMDDVIRLSHPVPANSRTLPDGASHYCAITFDDGFVSVVENALPELESRRIPATLFVPTGNLGRRPTWVSDPASPARRQLVISEQQLASLKDRELLTIGSHSVSHPNFLKLETAKAEWELTQSKRDLEAVLGHNVTLFSFPHGAYGQAQIALAKAAGYERIFTINPASDLTVSDGFVVGRVAADPDNWAVEFRLKLLGAYRWMAAVTAPVP